MFRNIKTTNFKAGICLSSTDVPNFHFFESRKKQDEAVSTPPVTKKMDKWGLLSCFGLALVLLSIPIFGTSFEVGNSDWPNTQDSITLYVSILISVFIASLNFGILGITRIYNHPEQIKLKIFTYIAIGLFCILFLGAIFI